MLLLAPFRVSVMFPAVRLMLPVPSEPSTALTTVPLLMGMPPLNELATLKVKEAVPSLIILPAPVMPELLKFVP